MIGRNVLWLIALAPTVGPVGCAPPAQNELEKSVRDEMKAKHNVGMVSFDLKKQDDGSYVGTATADNGDVYDLTTSPPKQGKMEWKTNLSQASRDKNMLAEVIRLTRDGLEEKFKTKVTELSLTKVADNNYEGTAETENKQKWNVKAEFDGTQVKWQAQAVKE
jgi:uncharacterized protein with FMN-binding domain